MYSSYYFNSITLTSSSDEGYLSCCVWADGTVRFLWTEQDGTCIMVESELVWEAYVKVCHIHPALRSLTQHNIAIPACMYLLQQWLVSF